MKTKSLRQTIFVIIRILGDMALIPLIFVIAYSIKFKLGWVFQELFAIRFGTIYTNAQFEPYINILGLVVILWTISFYFLGIYRRFTSLMPLIDEFVAITKAVILGTVELMIISFLYKSFPGSRYVLFYACIWGIILIFLFHALIYYMELLFIRNGYLKKATLIIGADSFGQDVVERIFLIPSLQLKYIGTLCDAEPKKIHFHLRGKLKYLGTVDQFKKAVEKYQVKVIFLTKKDILATQIHEIVEYCEQNKIELKIISRVSEHLGSNLGVEIFDGIPFEIHEPIKIPFSRLLIKRIFDFCSSLIIFIIGLPIFLCTILLIKIVSPKGSVFYFQERVGKHGKVFNMIKFRTMVIDAEKSTGPVMVDEEKENRFIPFGQFLRKTSLDELPQLINIIKGEMSLIGPRPERPFFVKQFEKEIPYYNLRHLMPGGITGWAQINGRSVLTRNPEHKLKYDLYYIKHWSFLLDIKIILKSFFVVLSQEEAY